MWLLVPRYGVNKEQHIWRWAGGNKSSIKPSWTAVLIFLLDSFQHELVAVRQRDREAHGSQLREDGEGAKDQEERGSSQEPEPERLSRCFHRSVRLRVVEMFGSSMRARARCGDVGLPSFEPELGTTTTWKSSRPFVEMVDLVYRLPTTIILIGFTESTKDFSFQKQGQPCFIMVERKSRV